MCGNWCKLLFDPTPHSTFNATDQDPPGKPSRTTPASLPASSGELPARGAAAKEGRTRDPGMPGTSGKPGWLLRRAPAQLPSAQLTKRLNTLFQCPSLSGRSRHWAPERNIHSTARANRRQVTSHPTRMSGVFFSLPIRWTQSPSLSLLLSIPTKKGEILLFAYVNRA